MTTDKYKILISVLGLITTLVWIAIFTFPTLNLKIIACDVGQGDGILITQGTKQILVDGGPNNKIVDCLSRYMPFWDKDIDLVILTNPDRDHYYGLMSVVESYSVKYFVANSYPKEDVAYQDLVKQIANQKINWITPTNETTISLEKVKFDFVWPATTEVSDMGSNQISIVFNLTYGEFDGLFTGDIVPESIDDILSLGEIRDVEYLKVPHHGSKNGLTKDLLLRSNPEIAVISAGRKNSYGHPSKEILEMLRETKTLRTDEKGDIVIETNGQTWSVAE